MSDTQTVAVIGLGLVGTALAGRLTAAGFSVLAYDRDAAARERYAAAGGQVEASLPALGARCAVAVLAVYDTAGVLSVVEGMAGGALRAIVDCSTGDPDALAALAGRLAERAIDFIEAPLSGSSQQIAAGEATMLLGAAPEALQRHEALLQALAAKRIAIGGAGMGARAKLATNLVLGLNRAALAEGLVFAQSLGIAPAAFLQLVLATPARSDAALAKGAMMVEERFEPPQSRIHQHLKDLELMRQQAAAAGQRLPLTDTHAALLRAAVAAGDGELDNAAILRQIRRETP